MASTLILLILGLVQGAVEVRETGQASELLNAVGFQGQCAVLKSAEDDTPLYDGPLPHDSGGPSARGSTRCRRPLIYVLYTCVRRLGRTLR
ncbi:hypothetical protein ACGFJC_52835 [Nonomuraea fuscirosea]|uniref:hypothetical protein n=1 Tax=Nonomuraea fuscirosea TaxID=1291556 RepID=UPI00342CE56F